MMGDAIRFVACHEVGHSLGLRHNMMDRGLSLLIRSVRKALQIR